MQQPQQDSCAWRAEGEPLNTVPAHNITAISYVYIEKLSMNSFYPFKMNN